MEYKILGKTGLKISRLGFGGIPIQRIDAAGTKALMQQMKDAGINYIDTARGYTVSEEYLGYALEGIRQDFVIATKSMSRDKEGMAKDIDISLSNLRTDYIDLYQVHNPTAKDIDTVTARMTRRNWTWNGYPAPAAEAEQQPTETENAPQAATQAAEGTDKEKEAETMTTTEREALERINARQNAANLFTNITPADIAAKAKEALA